MNEHQKTIKVKVQKNIQYFTTDCKLGKQNNIRTIQRIDQFIFVGCTNGNIGVINEQKETFHLVSTQKWEDKQMFHKEYISSMQVDKKGNLWTASGNGRILIWNKTKLISALLNDKNYSQRITKRPSLFSPTTASSTTHIFHLPPTTTTPITSIPFSHRGGPSSMLCVDPDNFFIGYYDGYMFISY